TGETGHRREHEARENARDDLARFPVTIGHPEAPIREVYGAGGKTRKPQILLWSFYYGAHTSTLPLSPFDGVEQTVNVPGSLPAVYVYTPQPDGCVGIASKNGPASCPWTFLT